MKTSHILPALALALLTTFSANAAVTPIDPSTGLTTTFNWSNGIAAADDTFTISLDAPASFGVTVSDAFVAGDEFALQLDGESIAWSSVATVGGYFTGYANNLLLGAGSHVFSLLVTVGAPGFTDGTGNISFTPLASAVPEPETAAMLLAGLGLIGVMSRRKAARTRKA